LTIGELAHLRRSLATTNPYVANHHAQQLFDRLAICLAPLSLTVLMLAVVSRRRMGRGWSALAALAAIGGFWLGMVLGETGFKSADFSAWTILWLPNLASLALAALLVRVMAARETAPV